MAPSGNLTDMIEFAENPEPRCPCILLLDTSGSMKGASIEALNRGLQVFRDDLVNDPLASRRVEVAVVTFDSDVHVVQHFVTVDQFVSPVLTSGGFTHMGSGIHASLDLINARKRQYRTNGVAYYRPWVFMITDGEPKGDSDEIMTQAAARIREDEEQKRMVFFAVGVENANMARLQELVVRAPVKLIGLNFTEMFLWLSTSMQRISQSRVDDQVSLPPPGWASV